ncbi:MAG: sulfotransferase [Sandarakinorhabdus sp.]|nr:sulfotransferase [Sandarakinorhabdus sp.]
MPPPSHDPRLLHAADALAQNRLEIAEPALAAWIADHPDDPYALRMLAEVNGRLARYREAEVLLARALEIAPEFDVARFNHALVLHRLGNSETALAELVVLLAKAPDNPSYLNLKAAVLARLGDYAAAIAIYENLLKALPNNPRAWMSYGHALKTVGRNADCIAAYRRSVAMEPTLGEAWWSLANLKTLRFSDADIAAMGAALSTPGLGDDDRLHLDFALGKAHEDAGAHAAAFEHYRAGNARRRGQLRWDADANHRHVIDCEALFTPAFIAARAGQGCPAPDPIFIVGLPRSGSTLIEQILSSHSAIEGTMELPDLGSIARRLGEKAGSKTSPSRYLEALADASAADLAAMGEAYLASTRIQRKTGRLLFIDKMPNNFAYTGLIQLILPNAVIIDARRHPMATCFSAWKQHFARGQAFTYDLGELGRYYADYVRLMAHFDAVAPGRVHRVHHEALVADTDAEVRRLLTRIGVPFEAGCLNFHENTRAVRTASSEQVRRPISSDGLDQWRHFEPWLRDLKATLGDTIAS